MEEVIETRVCKDCGETKPLTDFHKHGKGCRYNCKSCHNTKSRTHYANNTEQHKKTNTQYRLLHKDALLIKQKENNLKNAEYIAEYSLQYRSEHKEEIAIRDKKYKDANRDKINEGARLYHKNNPDNAKLSWSNRRASKLASIGSFTLSDINELFMNQEGKCMYCYADLVDNTHKDHIFPLTRYLYNGKENIQLLCSHCNSSKKASDPDVYEQKIGFITPERSLFLANLKALISSEWALKNLEDNALNEFSTPVN